MSVEERRDAPEGDGHVGAWPVLVLTVAWLAAVGTLFYASAHWQGDDNSYRVQGVGLAAAALLVLGLSWPLRRSGRHLFAGLRECWPGLLLAAAVFLAACGLRCAQLRVLPWPTQTLFEEMKKGGGGGLLLEGGPLPVEFRYTKALTALGLSRGGDPLDSLRFPFRINGCASLLFLMLCLRALGADGFSTAFVTLAAASLPWLAVGGGVADESFAGLAPSLGLLWMLAESERSPSRPAAWAAAAGVLGGVLLYEYVSFQASIVLAGAWLTFRAFFPREPGSPRRWLPLAAFLVAFLLVAAPALANMLHAPTDSALLNGLFRHRWGRRTPMVAAVAANLSGYLAALFGLKGPAIECFAIMRQPMVPPALAVLFAASFLAGLLRPRRPIERLLALGAALSVAVAAALANNFNPQRVTATLSLLLLLSGTLLTRVDDRLQARPGRRVFGVAILAAAAILCAANMKAVRQMESNGLARNCWVNDDYVMTRHIVDTARPGQRVLVRTPQYASYEWSHPDQAWLLEAKKLNVSGVDGEDLINGPPPPGTLVVVGYRSGTVSEDDVTWLLTVAGESRDASSLRVSRNLAGRAAAASVCVRCR